MSLYFNWSCDFQRFTKSKNSRNFRFALQPCSYRTKVQAHRCLIYKVQSAVFKEFSQLFVVLNCSSTAYLVYQNQKRLSRTFFKFFFEESSRSKPNFSVLRLSLRDSFNRIPNPRSNVKHFFHLFLRRTVPAYNSIPACPCRMPCKPHLTLTFSPI